MSETSGWKFRLAEASDAEAFTAWLVSNPQIDPKDVAAAQKAKNPTTVYFAVENPDGIVVTFAPVYMQMTIPHLVLNPETTADDRKKSLQVLLDGLMAFAVQFDIREITMLSLEQYPMAQWALNHGFDVDPRQFFKFDINRVLDQVKVDNTCAPVVGQ